MTTKDTGGPAFPTYESNRDGHIYGTASGLDLRDYFAAKAMAVHMAALSTWDAGSPEAWQQEISRLSYMTADAMLAERNKQ